MFVALSNSSPKAGLPKYQSPYKLVQFSKRSINFQFFLGLDLDLHGTLNNLLCGTIMCFQSTKGIRKMYGRQEFRNK